MSYIIITSEDSKVIMEITRDGIWVDPTVEPTITASQVLNVMDGYIKTLCKSVWTDAIEEAAALVMRSDLGKLPEDWRMGAANILTAYAESILGLKK